MNEAFLLSMIQSDRFRFFSIKIRSEDISGTLATLEKTWKQWVPNRPFEYFFLDEDFDKQYRAEERLGLIFSAFSGLAVFIGCLGLLGLISFTAQQRTREIGIRKVLGASVLQLVVLQSKEFVKLVGMANLVAWPVAYVAVNRWLADFAYRIDVGAGVFVLSSVVVLGIVVLTVGYQAWKAAQADPVEALRYE